MLRFSGKNMMVGQQYKREAYSEFQCIFSDVEVYHGTLLVISVQCINNVELAASAKAEPVIVSFLSPSSSSAHVEIIPYGEHLVHLGELVSPSQNEIVTQDNLTCIHAQWSGFYDRTDINHYNYTLAKNNLPFLMDSTSTRNTNIELNGLNLTNGDVYTLEVVAVNSGGIHSEPVRASVMVDSRKPRLSGI